MNNKRLEQLNTLYLQTSKHSNYQELAPCLLEFIDSKGLKVLSRHEKARWTYINHHVDFNDKKVADIGGNTGFFSFCAVDEGACSVDYVEGNEAHAKFVSLAAEISKHSQSIHVNHQYIDLEKQDIPTSVDVMLLLNVLHHIGDDYGDDKISKEFALTHMKNTLTRIAEQTSILILQVGFNWKGNINYPLFNDGTKAEMIEFIQNITGQTWELLHIGIAEKHNNDVEYKELDDSNISRVDSLGEFLNRPVFILKSKIKV